MYVLLYIFVCQLSSFADSENGGKIRGSGVAACWWPSAVATAIEWGRG